MFKPKNTSDATAVYHKALIYGMPGVGKTTQAKYLQESVGKGFVLSGESGLASIQSANVDYLPFSSFDGAEDHSNDVYSFKGILRLMNTIDFKMQGYRWIMVDSLTELSDLIFDFVEAETKAATLASGKTKDNGFKLWGDYASLMIRTCKYLRDLPYIVVLSALEKSEEDDNGRTIYRPMVKGNSVVAQLPGIFDLVFNLVASQSNTEPPQTVRRIVTSTIGGRLAKARDEHRVLKAIEDTASIADILAKLSASPVPTK